MVNSIMMRRSQRLQNVQSNQNTLLQDSGILKEETKPSSRKRGRPKKLISKEEALRPIEIVCACSSQKQKEVRVRRKSRPRKYILKDKVNCSTQEDGHALVMYLLRGTGEPSYTTKQNSDVMARPVNGPIWSGNICVCDESIGMVDGLAAHMSSKAGSEVLEAVQLLPSLLHAEMLPRQDVWPAKFDAFSPTDAIIDLYILPAHTRNEEHFSSLLNDITDKDVALKVVHDDISILIFSSHQLTYLHWRMTSGRYYLWAVILGKNSFFPLQQEENHRVMNTEPDVPSDHANEVYPGTQNESVFLNNCNSKEDRGRAETTPLIMENHGNNLQLEIPCDLTSKKIERAVSATPAEQGTSGITDYSMNHGVGSTQRTSMDKYHDCPSNEVTGSAHRLDLVAEGIEAICSPHMAETSKYGNFGASASLMAASPSRLQETQGGIEEPCVHSPSRVSSENIGTTVLDMATNFDDPTCTDEVSSKETCNKQVGSYSVKPMYAPTLCAILDKHGDIARDCPIKCPKMLSFVLERICEAVKEFEGVRFINLHRSHLQSLLSAITDAELVKLDVQWLRNRYEELVEAVDQIKEYKNLKVSRKKMEKMAESKKRAIKLKRSEMSKMQSEIEMLESEVAEIAEKSRSLSVAIRNVTSKCKHFCQNSLMDGLV